MQTPSADSVDAALSRVFDRPEFADRESSALFQLISDLAAAVRQWIASLLRRFLPEQWHPLFTWLIVAVLCALAAWAIYALVRSLVGGQRPLQVPGRPEATVLTRGESAERWEAAARAAAAAGRFRDAAIALYLAAVLRLEERGVLRYHAGKTPGDYRAEVRSHADWRRSFDAFIRQFLPLAYGSRTPDGAAFHSLRTTAAELGVNG